MATYGDGRFFVSTATNSGFNAWAELQGALAAAKQGKPLTFNQEYALESLWHEINHNRQSGLASINHLSRSDLPTQLMETVNQFTSRHTYTDLLAGMGVTAAHQPQILANGIGYYDYVRNLRTLIAAIGADEAAVAQALTQYNHTAKSFLTIDDDITGILMGLAKKKPILRGKLANIVAAIPDNPAFTARLSRL